MYMEEIYNIKNILFWSTRDIFNEEIDLLAGEFQIFRAYNLEHLESFFTNEIIHLVVIDSYFGLDEIKSKINYLYKNGYTTIPMLLAMENELLDERCDYFTHGISAFYNRKQLDFFLPTIMKIDRELTFKDGLKSMSIAVLDDDRLQLRIIKDMLFKNGILNVDFYSEPKPLLESNKTYDVYLIDLILPDIDGEVVMLEVRKHHENAIIIGISSIEKKSTIAKVLSIGANDYITKPVNEQVFMAKLYTHARILMLLKENEAKNRILRDLAIKDGLTGLYNHKHIHELLDVNIRLAKRYSRDISVIMLDIDNFKHINDNYGHRFGDIVLKSVAQALKETVRDSDIVGRYGGEEFIAILPETTADEAFTLGNRIRNAIMSLEFKKDMQITISGGVSQLLDTSENLIQEADQLLYVSKRNGKNQISYNQEINIKRKDILTS